MSTANILTVDSAAASLQEKTETWTSRPTLRRFSLLTADLAALLAASGLLTWALHLSMTPYSLPELVRLAVPLAFACAIGLYSNTLTHPAVELRKVVCALALGSMVLALMEKPSYGVNVQAALAIGFLTNVALVMGARIAVRSVLIRLGLWLTPAVIIGAGPLSRTLIQTLEKHKHIGLKPVAILTSLFEGDELLAGDLVTEHPRYATRLRDELGISHALIADESLSAKELDSTVERYQQCFERVTVIPAGSALGSLRVTAVDLGGLMGLSVPGVNFGLGGRAVKRGLDLAFASFAIFLASPVLVALYVATRLTSPGPVFYGQRRIGRQGHYFTAWKFRSMVTNADEVLEQHLAGNAELRKEWEATRKLTNDPRVLPVGKLLRKTSLDELPQLWNVLRGEMSLVGPRPIVDAEVPRYGETFEYYKMVRPGVTGMWQISGRSNTTYAERVQYDDYFVRNWTVWLDLYILFRTVKTVLLREGAV